MTVRRPPRISEVILSLMLPGGGYRESVLGDMHEEFHRRASDPVWGPDRARAWYRRHALRIAVGYAVRRVFIRGCFRPLGEVSYVTTERGGGMMSDVWSDVKFAFRTHRRAPGLTAVALTTLALAVGANTAIFSVVDAVYLKPLPFAQPDRLVRMGLNSVDRPDIMTVHSAGGFLEWRERSTSFESMAAWGYRTFLVERGEVAERVTVALSVGSLFDVLGRSAFRGRTFTAAEEGPGEEGLAVLSHEYWSTRLGGGDVVGTTLRIQGVPHEIIGIMPPDFAYPRAAAIWITAPFDAATLAARNNFFLRTVARLRDGATVTRAREEMEVLAADVRERFPESYGDVGITVESMGDWLRAGAGNLWLVLMTGVSVVLLIGCVNLANLLLARGTHRRSEFAVRRALGAGGGRLMRQALTESLVLALLGGAVGALSGAGLLELLLRWMPGGVPRAESVGVDGRVLAFTLILSALAGVLFGILPAWQARRDAIGARLRRGRRSGWLRNGLVVTEVAMALLLLAAGGLTLRSFAQVSQQDPGIDTDDLFALPMTLSEERPAAERHETYRRLEERLSSLPGVASVGVVSSMPVTDFTPGAWVNEPGVVHEGVRRPGAKYQVVSPGYFGTAGVELLQGRLLTRDDGIAGSPSVVISETAARSCFPTRIPWASASTWA